MLSLTFLWVILPIALIMSISSTDAFTTPSRPSSGIRNVAVSLSPTDITDVSSLLLVKCDVKLLGIAGVLKTAVSGVHMMNPDVQAQVLSDGSHALMDFPMIFNKTSKLRMRYAQVMGRIMVLGIGLLPNHGFHAEEMAVQLFLLGVSMKPILRSIKLYQCISSSKCKDECELELEDLEESLP